MNSSHKIQQIEKARNYARESKLILESLGEDPIDKQAYSKLTYDAVYSLSSACASITKILDIATK